MAQQTLLGGDGVTGETGATHNSKANSNFTELYGATAAAQSTADGANSAISAHISDASAAHASEAISYDNTESGLGSTNVKDALDELASAGGAADASTTIKGIIEIATVAEAIAGTDTARAVTPEGVKSYADPHIYSTAKTGTAIAFTDTAIYGTVSSPITGNITANQTSAKVGCRVLIIHNHSAEPTFDANYKLTFGSYQVNKVNLIECKYLQSNYIAYSISYVA